MRLLIAIPIKNENEGREYQKRMAACEATWLKDCPCDYKFFTDEELGLDYKSATIRPDRTRGMCKYALENGYDYLFRCDSDTYVWLNRLLACGFEQHDYMGYCIEFFPPLPSKRTAHGGIGFFLSRRAMQIVADAKPFRCYDGNYWGDIWTGELLFKHKIYCHRDKRFMDGSGSTKHHGNIFAHELPEDHQFISIHPLPVENMIEMYERFPRMSDATVEPKYTLWDADLFPEGGRKV